ncbi:hypothetical protein RJ639_016506 [Escallonia herrerae]|uniref:DUF868 domain-containing protein n=1 Tax=Escallonia herrerae TaxID=1293975 RepID=A0AA89AL27_9ASTE|nr:hypothetical protein RJ639_016506 [Escallonia herrerae]
MSNHNSSLTITPTPSKAAAPPPSPAPTPGNPNLITCLYNTDLGLIALTWSRSLFGRHLRLHLLLDNPTADDDEDTSFPSAPSFHLSIKPFCFWSKQGSKKLNTTNATKAIYLYWDLTRAKFGSRPEPQSGFYIAVVIEGKTTLLVGDSPQQAYAKTKALKPNKTQAMVLRREHVYGNRHYVTKANINGRTRDISICCKTGPDPKLCFSVDGKRVLQVKHLKWKFRGNERIEVDGVYIQVSWDVYNWLFEDEDQDGYALFMFKFEKLGSEEDFEGLNSGMVLWGQDSCGFGFERKKMKKGLLRPAARSSSSSSLSSASSNCSSVMEWASVEENELKGPSGFSLLVYAWKK